MDVRIEYMPLSELRKWPRNPKDHDLGALHQSLARFGFVNPLIIDERTGQLVAGHGRLDALIQMKASGQNPPERIKLAEDGEWLVPVVRGISFNSDTEAEAYALADNRLAELGGWIEDKLAGVLKDIWEVESLEGTGFSDEDLDEIFGRLSSEGFDEVRIGKKVTCPHCGHEFEA